MGVLATGLDDIMWPKNLRSLLEVMSGLCNLDLASILDVHCALAGFNAYVWFLLNAYGTAQHFHQTTPYTTTHRHATPRLL